MELERPGISMKECPFCKAKVPDIAHYCAKCGKQFGINEAAEATAQEEPAANIHVETRYVPGHNDIAILKISGNCDSKQVKRLNLELSNLRDENPKIVIIDLSGTESICSMGLSTLISFVSDREDEREKSTAVVNIRPAVAHVMDSLGIAVMLPVYNSIAEAINILRGAPPSS